ncbi:hypothetical protein QBC40DRAFT_284633 [Triangularia verruculosa]|uniref:Uncharacterized protein n=1 Tax=Triangularia verruculosa TaxID=2587418 RepID=A0AAN6XG09_9PEZI|nr:hypothetical protein QBC40DRAFT_284633 [Triangularia verruculosa]
MAVPLLLRNMNGGLQPSEKHRMRKSVLEDELSQSINVAAFEKSLLTTEITSIRFLGFNHVGSCIDRPLNDEYLNAYLKTRGSFTATTLFINRDLVRGNEPWPDDANRLRLSQAAFLLLRSNCHLSPSFVNALANLQHPSPAGFPSQAAESSPNFWFFVPVRVQVQCSDSAVHVGSKSKSQMNPLNYLHLVGPNVDIRGSKIAVNYLFRYADADESMAVVFNFQDGRWKKVVEEPIIRLRNSYKECTSAPMSRDPIYLQMAILNSVLRWWNNSLNSFDDQLISYEEDLLRQDLTDGGLLRVNAETNQSLHCMAAHLHRYGSELSSLSEILTSCRDYNRRFHQKFALLGIRKTPDDLSNILNALNVAASHLSVISIFRDELERKISNVLALLVDNNRAISDQLLIRNGETMQQILKAAQTEAEESRNVAVETKHLTEEMTKILHATRQETEAAGQLALQTQKLATEMMKDSVAMKTVALLTAFFLPGTSFAAILAMPFFNDDDSFLAGPEKIWIWVVFTVPATLLCFGFYISWSRMQTRRRARDMPADVEMVTAPSAGRG